MFRFSVRELMLTSALVGVAVSWLVSRAEVAELKREMEERNAKALLIDQFIRYAGYTANGDVGEVVLTSQDTKVRSTSCYLDISRRSDGARRRVWSWHSDFPTPSEKSNTPW